MLLKTLAALVVLAPAAALAATAGAPDAAQVWLATVDKGAYADSWTAAGTLFRAQITADKWAAALKGVREPLGAVVSRKLASEKETATLPGAPDGIANSSWLIHSLLTNAPYYMVFGPVSAPPRPGVCT